MSIMAMLLIISPFQSSAQDAVSPLLEKEPVLKQSEYLTTLVKNLFKLPKESFLSSPKIVSIDSSSYMEICTFVWQKKLFQIYYFSRIDEEKLVHDLSVSCVVKTNKGQISLFLGDLYMDGKIDHAVTKIDSSVYYHLIGVDRAGNPYFENGFPVLNSVGEKKGVLSDLQKKFDDVIQDLDLMMLNTIPKSDRVYL